jgi:hypothetical protein
MSIALKRDCLDMAIRTSLLIPGDIVSQAQEYYDFITGTKTEEILKAAHAFADAVNKSSGKPEPAATDAKGA